MKKRTKMESSEKAEFKRWLGSHWNPALNKPKGQDEWDWATKVFRDLKGKKNSEDDMKYDPKDLKDKIDEGIHEEVMGIPSREEELVSEIEDTWVSLEARGADVDKIMQLVEDYIELHKLNPR